MTYMPVALWLVLQIWLQTEVITFSGDRIAFKKGTFKDENGTLKNFDV